MSNKYPPCTLRTKNSVESEKITESTDKAESIKIGFFFIVFSVWFLSLPFTLLSSIYIGVAIDKLAAPALIVVWCALYFTGRAKLSQGKSAFIFVAIFFFFIRNISYIDNLTLFGSFIWEDAIRLGYFCLPILFVDNYEKVKAACKLISINATVGCVSAFMVAVGILTLPYERFSQSRISLDIDKSIGLFTSYGDLAQFSAYFLLLTLFIPSSLMAGKKTLLRASAFSIVVMGLIGNQSRSFLLSIIVALLISYFFSFRSKKSEGSILFNLVLIFAVIAVMAIIGVFFSNIVGMLSGLGGSQAEKTAAGRLLQFQMAFDLIRQFPVLGVDSEIFSQYSEYIHGIHNMWLGQLTRGGIVSAVLLFILIVMIYRTALDLFKKQKTRPFALVSIGYVFAIMVSTLFYPADTSLFWIMLGMIAAIGTTLSVSKSDI